MLQEFAQEVENTARKVMEEIHTAMPGTIVSLCPYLSASRQAPASPIPSKKVTAASSLYPR